MQFLVDSWYYLDGKKTIIGALVALGYIVGAQFGFWEFVENGTVMHVIDLVCGVGIAHKGVKAYRDLR